MGEKFRSCWTPLALILEESMERRSARRCLRAPLAPWYDEPDDDDIVTKARDAAQGRPASATATHVGFDPTSPACGYFRLQSYST